MNDNEPVAELRAPRRRRSSLLDRWIQEQRLSTLTCSSNSHSSELVDNFDTTIPTRGTLPNPYLAYPDVRRHHKLIDDSDCSTVESYELLEEDEIAESVVAKERVVQVEPATPTKKKLHASLRGLRISVPFRASSPSSSSSTFTPSRARRSIFNLGRHDPSPSPQSSPQPSTPPNLPGHGPSSSLSISILGSSSSPFSSVSTARTPGTPATQSVSAQIRDRDDDASRYLSPNVAKWRPSVMGHFPGSPSSTTHSEDAEIPPSRPSFSSTYTSTTGVSETLSSHTQSSHRPRFRSGMSSFTIFTSTGTESSRTEEDLDAASSSHAPRSRSDDHQATRTRASSSSTLLSTIGGKLVGGGSGSGSGGSPSRAMPLTPRSPNVSPSDWSEKHGSPTSEAGSSSKPYEVYSYNPKTSTTKPPSILSGHRVPSIMGSTRAPSIMESTRGSKRSKKLIVSGIGPGDDERVEGIKGWCESFGEVKRITRMPNGELMIEWRDTQVADTVCRLRARVSIPGVGSVHLSWCHGKKR